MESERIVKSDSQNVVEIIKGADGKRFVKLPNSLENKKALQAAATVLPDTYEVCNPIAIVVCYDLLGLPDKEIAKALGFSTAQIDLIKESNTYHTLRNSVVKSALNEGTDEVTGLFREHARDAAKVLIDNMTSNMSSASMNAAKRVLEMAGYGPKRPSEDKMSKGLNIIIMDQPKTKVVE